MPSNANNLIVLGIKNDNNVNARPQSGPQDADAVFEVLVISILQCQVVV